MKLGTRFIVFPINGAFPPSSDSSSIKEVSSFPSESTRESGFKTHSTDPKGGENCEEKDISFSDESNAADTYTFCDDLGDITQTSNDIDFFENLKDKDPGDFLYDGWPETGNFDDVDRMFRSSDSTFGLGANKEDELNWSPSADDTEGTGDMPKTDFRFPLPETYLGKDLLQNDDPTETYYVDDPAMTCVPTFLKDCSWPADKYESSLAKRPATMTNSCLDDISLEAASLLQLQLVMEQIEKPLQRHGGRLEHNETYCGSCYGAETSDECCNSCEEVCEAYRKKGWGTTNTDLVDQKGGFCSESTRRTG